MTESNWKGNGDNKQVDSFPHEQCMRMCTVFPTDQLALCGAPEAPEGECQGAVGVSGVGHQGACRVCAEGGVQTHTF